VAAGIVYGLGFYTYAAYRLTPLLLLLVARGKEKRVVGLAVAAAALVVLPLAIFAARQPDVFFNRINVLRQVPTAHPVQEFVSNLWRTGRMFFFAGDPNPRHNLPGRAALFWPVGLLFALGVPVAWRRQRWLVWWLVIGLLPAVLVNEGVPNSWRAVLAAPAAFLLAALGAEWIGEQLTQPALAFGLAAVVAGAAAVDVYRSYYVTWARDPRVAVWFDASLMNSAATLNALPNELPKYVILEPDPVNVRGLPIAAQTIMFLTDTATMERQQAKNLHYLLPDQTNQIVRGYVYVCFVAGVPP
jgi:hypothetical protein